MPSTMPSGASAMSPSTMKRASPFSSITRMPCASIGSWIASRPFASARGGTDTSATALPEIGGNRVPPDASARSVKASAISVPPFAEGAKCASAVLAATVSSGRPGSENAPRKSSASKREVARAGHAQSDIDARRPSSGIRPARRRNARSFAWAIEARLSPSSAKTPMRRRWRRRGSPRCRLNARRSPSGRRRRELRKESR